MSARVAHEMFRYAAAHGFFNETADYHDADLNPKGLFNFRFEFACGNNQIPWQGAGYDAPATTALDAQSVDPVYAGQAVDLVGATVAPAGNPVDALLFAAVRTAFAAAARYSCLITTFVRPGAHIAFLSPHCRSSLRWVITTSIPI